MKTIHKFPLEITDHIEILMPEGAEFLAVAEQHGRAYIWCKVDSGHPKKRIHFELRGTGASFDGTEDIFLDTFQMYNGNMVWHLFTSTTGIPTIS